MKFFQTLSGKFIFTLTVLVFLIAAVFAGINFITDLPTPELYGKTPINSHFERPRFAVTCLNAERSNITFAELKTLYASGGVYVLQLVRVCADSLLGKGSPKKIDSVRAFIPRAKTNLLITDLDHLESQVKAPSVDSVFFFGSAKTYPLVYTDSTAAPFAYDSLISKFTLTGVTAIARNTGKAADANGYRFIIEKVVDEFKSSDFVHVSNEVSFAPGCVYQGGTKFCTKFDQIHKEGLRQGFILHNYFYGGKLVQSVPVYTYTSENRRPEFATPQQALAIPKAILLDKFIYTP